MRFVALPLFLMGVISFVGCPEGSDHRSRSGPADLVEEICGDGIDNDEDGQTDCDDTECANLFSCKNPSLDGGLHDAGPVVDTGSQPVQDAGGGSAAPDGGGSAAPIDSGSSSGVEICDDQIDNDGDLMTDCADTDCFGVGECPRGPEDCGDERDNNGDNLVDCDDPLCEREPECGGETGMSCSEIVMCAQTCEDDACRVQCLATGSEQGQRLAQALLECDSANNCEGDMGCLTDHCADQWAACESDMPGG